MHAILEYLAWPSRPARLAPALRATPERAVLAAEKGRGGQAYFLTDGEPVVFRDFITEMLKTQNVDAGTRTVPYGQAATLATMGDLLWGALHLSSRPPLTRSELLLVGAR